MCPPVNLALHLEKEAVSGLDCCTVGGREMEADALQRAFDETDGVGDFAQKRKAQSRVFFSFVIIT